MNVITSLIGRVFLMILAFIIFCCYNFLFLFCLVVFCLFMAIHFCFVVIVLFVYISFSFDKNNKNNMKKDRKINSYKEIINKHLSHKSQSTSPHNHVVNGEMFISQVSGVHVLYVPLCFCGM